MPLSGFSQCVLSQSKPQATKLWVFRMLYKGKIYIRIVRVYRLYSLHLHSYMFVCGMHMTQTPKRETVWHTSTGH